MDAVFIEEVCACLLIYQAKLRVHSLTRNIRRSSNVDEPEPVGATTVNMSLLWKHWEFDLDDKVEKPLTEPVKFKLEPFDSAPGDVLYRGLSLSRSLQILAFWIGRNCKFLQLVSDAGGRTSAKVMRTLHKPGIEAVHSQLCCLDVMFNRDDSYAAVLWCPPPSPGADAPAVPSLRGTFLTLSRLNIDAGIVDVRGALAVDTDARGYHFHPTEPLIAITCADQYLICKYGIDGFSVLRTIDAAEARATLFIPGKPNGPSSPPSTDETVKEAPVTGLPPIYFSTCGTFLFSRDWDAFAWVKDVKSHDVVLSGRAVLDSFMEEAAEARKADESRRVVRAPNADEARRTEATHTTDTSGSTEPEPAPGQWLLTEMHPPVMYEGTLYAVGRHRLKIFRIRTYIVLGWAADADNLWWPVIEDPKKEAPQPKDPTWYRRVLCAIPQSMSTWRAVLYWPPGRDACFTLVLFPTPESRSSAAESMPTVIYTTRSWLDVYSPNNGFGIEWLRGHASGCPYQLKA